MSVFGQDKRRLIPIVSFTLALTLLVASMFLNWLVVSGNSSTFVLDKYDAEYPIKVESSLFSSTTYYSNGEKDTLIYSELSSILSITHLQVEASVAAKLTAASTLILMAVSFLFILIISMCFLAYFAGFAVPNSYFSTFSKWLPILGSLLLVVFMIIGWSLWLSITVDEKLALAAAKNSVLARESLWKGTGYEAAYSKFETLTKDLQFSYGFFVALAAINFGILGTVSYFMFPIKAMGSPEIPYYYESYQGDRLLLQKLQEHFQVSSIQSVKVPNLLSIRE